MIPTWRWFALLGLAAIPLAASQFIPAAGALFWLQLALAGVVWLADHRASAPPKALRARRLHEPHLSLGADNLVKLEITNLSSLRLEVWARDEFPDRMDADAVLLSASLDPESSQTLSYHLRPLARGDYQFGAINLRYRSRLGLFWRQVSLPAHEDVGVFPNLLELRKFDLLARRGTLHEVGLKNARRFGAGTEFERLRDYQPDDDFRRIHWKATARRGKPISLEFEPERSQNVVIMLDTGRLMAAKTNGLTKLDYALNTALLVAYVASLRGDRVALLAFADRVVRFLPPRRGRRWFYSVLDSMYNLQPVRTEPSFGAAFQFLAARHLRRSLLILFTDLVEPGVSSRLLAHLAQAARHHLVVCVTVADPSLLRPAEAAVVDSSSLYEKAVAQRLLAQRREALNRLRHGGVIPLDLPAHQLSPQVINKYLELKARSGL